jgi:hypothetical protein
MWVDCSYSEITMLAAVVKRAFDDIELREKSSGSTECARKALDWVRGATFIDGDLDEFMSFRSICYELGWPRDELVDLANLLYEGEYDSVRKLGDGFQLNYRGPTQGSGFDLFCLSSESESFLWSILCSNALSNEFSS